MTRIDDDESDDECALRAGDVVRLREPHELHPAGTRGHIVGFYAIGPREALVALDSGDELRVPSMMLEREELP
jgi:hypothetical protein